MEHFLVIGAMQSEICGVCDLLRKTEEKRAGAFAYTQGVLDGVRLSVCCCGIGKVHSGAACAALLTQLPDVTGVINVGVAGGVGKGVRQGDVVVATATVQHDYDQTEDGVPQGQIPGFSSPYFACHEALHHRLCAALKKTDCVFHRGIIASGDQFIGSNEKAALLRERFDALACDMESAAIGQVCALYGVPYLAMRAISDNGDDDAVQSFYAFLQTAVARSTAALAAFVREGA